MNQPASEKIPDFQAIREENLQVFLQAQGWQEASSQRLNPTSAPYGTYRLLKADKTIILLDCPNPAASRQRLDRMAWVAELVNDMGLGLRAPRLQAMDKAAGFALIEDFGTDSLSVLFEAGGDRELYLSAALDGLVNLHRQFDPARIEQTGNDFATNDFEWAVRQAARFTEWYWPARFGHETPPDIAAEYLALWKKILNELPPMPKTLSLGNYDAAHLFPRQDGLGVLGFREALLASPACDVVSLLEDDTYDLKPETVSALRTQYADAMQDTMDMHLFDRHYAVYGAIHHAAAMGDFVCHALHENDPHWLETLPVAAQWLEHALQSDDGLVLMRKWFARHCPDCMSPLDNIRYFAK